MSHQRRGLMTLSSSKRERMSEEGKSVPAICLPPCAQNNFHKPQQTHRYTFTTVNSSTCSLVQPTFPYTTFALRNKNLVLVWWLIVKAFTELMRGAVHIVNDVERALIHCRVSCRYWCVGSTVLLSHLLWSRVMNGWISIPANDLVKCRKKCLNGVKRLVFVLPLIIFPVPYIQWEKWTGDLICCLPLCLLLCLFAASQSSPPPSLSMSLCPPFLVSLFEMNHFFFFCTQIKVGEQQLLWR